MTRKLTIRMIGLFVALATAIVVLAPTASAQTTTPPQLTVQAFSYDKPTGQTPDLELGTITITTRYSYTMIATGPVGGTVTPSATLKWEEPACDKTGVTVVGSLSQSLNLGGTPPPGFVDTTSTFTVSISSQAPGETDIKCTFKGQVGAVVGAGSAIPPSNQVVQGVLVKGKFLGLLSASVPTGTILEGGPQKEVRYDIDITNLGNSLTTIQFDLKSSVPEGWKTVPPLAITLQSTQQGGTQVNQKVAFLIQTPHKNGWNNDETTFQLEMTPHSTKDIEIKGTPVQVNVLTRVRGIYVPGPEPLLLVGAIVGTALVARMLRKD